MSRRQTVSPPNAHAAVITSLIAEIGCGEVASYGMIASLLPGVTPRMVGSALRALGPKSAVPWHRVVQSAGTIADRQGAALQRKKLIAEGVAFRPNGAVDWKKHRWRGPSPVWIARAGLDFDDAMAVIAGWGG